MSINISVTTVAKYININDNCSYYVTSEKFQFLYFFKILQINDIINKHDSSRHAITLAVPVDIVA